MISPGHLIEQKKPSSRFSKIARLPMARIHGKILVPVPVRRAGGKFAAVDSMTATAKDIIPKFFIQILLAGSC
jgi:hypothetical protein